MLALSAIGCETETFDYGGSLGVPYATAMDRPLEACPTALRPVRTDTLATGLDTPWDVAFLLDGGALVTERPGRIREFDPLGGLRPEPWATLDVYAEFEAGLLGIDVRYRESGASPEEVFVAATVDHERGGTIQRALDAIVRRISRSLNPEAGHARQLELYRMYEGDDGTITTAAVLGGIPSGPIHTGGAVRFGPSGELFLSTGDAGLPQSAADPESLRGKILRIDPDGGAPTPAAAGRTWAMGTRESQGLAWHPETGDLFAIEHGPSGLEPEGLRTGHDELNVVPRGADLGWPVAAGMSSENHLTPPIVVWEPAIAPAGLAIFDDPDSAWHGDVFVTGLRGRSLRRIELARSGDGWSAECEEVLFERELGRLRLLRQAPDGTLWVGTSNRDQNGTPEADSDLILRLHPPREGNES